MSETKSSDHENETSWKRVEEIEEKMKKNEEKLKLLAEIAPDPV